MIEPIARMMILSTLWLIWAVSSLTLSGPVGDKYGKVARDSQLAAGRTNVFSLELQKVETGTYVASLGFGNPSQPILVAFDTGSSDTWVRLINSTDCKKSEQPCKESDHQFFNISQSSTFKPLGEDFSVIYGTGSVEGAWAYDSVVVNNRTIPSYRFGVVEKSQDATSYGIVGLGLKKFEVTYTFSYGINKVTQSTHQSDRPRFVYDNFPTRLKDEGYIKKVCYSILYPQDGSDQNGVITFGGLDTAKYESLLLMPIIQRSTGDWKSYDEPYLLTVSLEQMKVARNNNEKPVLGKPYPVLIDTLTYPIAAPSKVIKNLAILLGGKFLVQQSAIAYPCTNDIKLKFYFGGAYLQVSASDISVNKGSSCFLPMIDSGDDFMILGEVFLSKFYTFFDLEKLQIAIGYPKRSSEENLVSLASDETPPNTKKVPKYSTIFNYSSSDILSLNYSSLI